MISWLDIVRINKLKIIRLLDNSDLIDDLNEKEF